MCFNGGKNPKKPSDGGAVTPCPCSVNIDTRPVVVCVCPDCTKTDGLAAVGAPSGGTFAWTTADDSIATVSGSGDSATVTGVAAGVTTVTVEYTCAGGSSSCTASVSVTVVKIELELKNSETIVASPENEDYDTEKAAAGTDKLGPLPMGQGRADAPFKDNSYISPLMVIGTISPAAAAGLTFRWKRLLTRRSWFIRKDPSADKWKVTQDARRGFPDDDTGDDAFNDPTPSANMKIYIYDNSGDYFPSNPLNKVGDYIYHEKDFTYRVDLSRRGSWITCAQFHVGQKIIAKRKATTGRVADDWDGVENSTAVRTLSVDVTEAKVRSIVGGSWPIEIDAGANH